MELAVGLAGAVAAMHDRGVMHRDIAPEHVVVSGSRSPCLVGFSLASSFAEIRPEFSHHSQILGTLAYLAPEQTGRTARPVDQRADLYALGAVLYELATGGPPFGSGDPLRLTHDHLARVPAAPHAVNAAVPRSLSRIILHLLEKEPDDRYQSAAGVVHDLALVRDATAAPPPATSASASTTSRRGCSRRRACSGAVTRSQRWRGPSSVRRPAGAVACWSRAIPGSARRRSSTSCAPRSRRTEAGSSPASSTSSGATSSSTASTWRFGHWAGSCSPSRRTSSSRFVTASDRCSGATRRSPPRWCRSSRRSSTSSRMWGTR